MSKEIRSSLAELVACRVLAEHLGFITLAQLEEERRETDTVGRTLHDLARSVECRVHNERLSLRFGVVVSCFVVLVLLL